MKQILIMIAGLVLIISCTNGTGKKGKKKQTSKEYLKQSDLITFKPDTTVAYISLINSKNVDSLLGKNVMDRLVLKELPSSSVISSDLKQRFTFYFHPGSVKKEFSEFKVSYVHQKEKKEFVTTLKEFKTESSIKLGMTMSDFKAIKGEPDSLVHGASTLFYYRIDTYKNAEFLKKYNMPIYDANYTFQKGYLHEFKFGFEYP